MKIYVFHVEKVAWFVQKMILLSVRNVIQAFIRIATMYVKCAQIIVKLVQEINLASCLWMELYNLKEK